ncbi:MAG: hypothetical protein L0G96_06740 [Acinetobacter sp.]|nr:hypothetical protein [Acinetobacter sp.]
MEIQNLRLQLLHIADGDIDKAQSMEAYVLAEAKTTLEKNVGEEPKPTQGMPESEEECGCIICLLGKAIKEMPPELFVKLPA